jgi:hypothetical protein
MLRSRLGLKACGLCVMLVGMFAFTGVAQASTGALWRIGGAQAKGGEIVEAESEATGITLLTELGGKFIHIKCPNLKLVGAQLVEPNGGFTGRIDLSGCKFFFLQTSGGTLVEAKVCEPRAEGVNGLIVTNSITGLIVLHQPSGGSKEGVLEVKPTAAGGLLTTIPLGAPEPNNECAFGEKLKIAGVFFLKDCEGKFSAELVKHLVEELKALTKLTINEGTKAATIDGSALLFLSSPNTGKLWAGLPN